MVKPSSRKQATARRTNLVKARAARNGRSKTGNAGGGRKKKAS